MAFNITPSVLFELSIDFSGILWHPRSLAYI